MDDFLFDVPGRIYEDGRHIGARVLDHVGLRGSWVSAGFDVARGVVTYKSFGVSVSLPVRRWGVPYGAYTPSLDSNFSESARLRYENPRFRAIHPNHAFIQRREFFEANFTPEESREEQTALMNFQLDCISRWMPCQRLDELFPKARTEYEAEVEWWHDRTLNGLETEKDNFFTPSCFPTIEIRAREEHEVLVGDIVRAKVMHDPTAGDINELVWLLDVRLLQVLKGKAPAPVGSIISVYEPTMVGPVTADRPRRLHAVVIAGRTYEAWKAPGLVVYAGDCGIVEALPENIAAARKGVEDDFGV